MVRLQPFWCCLKLNTERKSQFHYGSITTVALLIVSTLFSAVSIPLWFDYNYFNEMPKILDAKVSIPLWFDYNIEQTLMNVHPATVSIPLWFDYNKRTVPANRMIVRSLNSTMVRLQLIIRIERRRLENEVSIPLWFDYN